MSNFGMPAGISLDERFLIEIAQWLARALQYSLDHGSCKDLAQKAHTTMMRALEVKSFLEFGVLKDGLIIGEGTSTGVMSGPLSNGLAATNGGLRSRMAPYLHERGVLVMRFMHGTTLEELSTFVELIALRPPDIFDRGGLPYLVAERGISRIAIEEIAHDIADDEREAQRCREKLRASFSEMLANLRAHRFSGAIGEHNAELFEYPEIAVAILEEDEHGIAEAAAGLALMARQEEQRTGEPLAHKLRTVFLTLRPSSRDRMLLGFPSLLGEFREALGWAFAGFSEGELAELAFPCVRTHADELDVMMYALAAAVPHQGRRLSALRLLAMRLNDLPSDPAGTAVLGAVARPVEEFDSFFRERACLSGPAARALAQREASHGGTSPSSLPPPAGSLAPPGHSMPAFDERHKVMEMIEIAARTSSFDVFCRSLPAVAAAYSADEGNAALIGLLRGLGEVSAPKWRGDAEAAISMIAPPAAARILRELDASNASLEGAPLEDVVQTVKLLAASAPEPIFELLESSQNPAMRRVLLEALPLAGPAVLPLVRVKLASPNWATVRSMIALLPRVGGSVSDLEIAARHPNEKVRIEVVRALRAMPQDEKSMDLVVSYICDASPEVSQPARVSLRGELLSVASVLTVAALASDGDQSEELRRRLIQTLGRSSQEAAAAALFKLLQPTGMIDVGSASQLRDVAASALRGSPSPAAARHFQEGLRSSVWRVRKACERAAGGG